MLVLLKTVVIEMFQTMDTNFLSLNSISDLRVLHGSNNLQSCYQYEVLNDDNEKLLNIKVYDKFLDLVGRDGHQPVGSRLGHIVGINSHADVFYKRIVKAQNYGVSRLELSIHRAALERYKPFQPSLKTRWHLALPAAMSDIVERVLGDSEVI